MTTSDLPEGFPDIGELERLANQFFKALPGDAPAIRTAGGSTMPTQGFDMNTSNPLSVGNIPASAAYSGVSPSVVNIFSGVDSPDNQSIAPVAAPMGFGFDPPSLGGIGATIPSLP